MIRHCVVCGRETPRGVSLKELLWPGGQYGWTRRMAAGNELLRCGACEETRKAATLVRDVNPPSRER